MLKGFKDFVMRGNVIDLAVAVVLGAAFIAVVNAVVKGLITPIIAAAVYFLIVLPVNKLLERLAQGREAEPEAPSPEVLLLTEIRDSLRTR